MNIAPRAIAHTPTYALKRLVWSLVRRRRFCYQTTTTRGWRIHGDTTDWIQRSLYYFGTWEPNLTAWVERSLRPGDTFVDVGANIGYFTLLAAQCVGPNGHVVAIEPMPTIQRHLADHVRDNDLRNVRLVQQAAVGPETPAVVALFCGDEGNIGSTGMISRGGSRRTIMVPAATLASLITLEESRRARIIKIDVEGVEYETIRGLDLEAHEFRRDLEIVVEVSHEPGSVDGNVFIAYMAARGFHPYVVPEDYGFRRYANKRAVVIPPTRLTQRLTAMNNIVFSRRDVAAL